MPGWQKCRGSPSSAVVSPPRISLGRGHNAQGIGLFRASLRAVAAAHHLPTTAPGMPTSAGGSCSTSHTHQAAFGDEAGASASPSRHPASLEREAAPPLTTDGTEQLNWRMDMRRMIAGMGVWSGSPHQSPASPRGERRTDERSHSQIKMLLKSVSAANRCVESLTESVAEHRRSSDIASSHHHTSPPRPRATLNGPPQADVRGVRFPTPPAGRPAAAASPELGSSPGVDSTPQRQAKPPQQAASKLVKFYGETVRCFSD